MCTACRNPIWFYSLRIILLIRKLLHSVNLITLFSFAAGISVVNALLQKGVLEHVSIQVQFSFTELSMLNQDTISWTINVNQTLARILSTPNKWAQSCHLSMSTWTLAINRSLPIKCAQSCELLIWIEY